MRSAAKVATRNKKLTGRLLSLPRNTMKDTVPKIAIKADTKFGLPKLPTRSREYVRSTR